MPDLIRMRALRPWCNREHEGDVAIGLEFDATEDRAGDLERNGLAVRIPVSVPEDEAQEQEPPMEFARKEVGVKPVRRSRSRVERT